MKNRRSWTTVAMFAVLSARAALAANPALGSGSGPGWSAIGAQNVGQGQQAFSVEVGFPGATLSYLRGVTPTADIGARIGANYAYEGIFSAQVPGLRGEVLLRLKLLETSGVSVALRGGFGFFGYFSLNAFVPGVTLPLGVSASLPLSSALAVSGGLDIPLFITFGSAGGFTVPLLLNGGLEYFLDKGWAVTFRIRLGPAINPSGFRFGTPTVLMMDLAAGMAFRF